MFSSKDILFFPFCFVILVLCLSLLEARVWTTACRHWEFKDLEICSLLVQHLQSPVSATKLNVLKVCPGNLSHAEISGYSFSPGLVHICKAALFQGSRKGRATYLQMILDILQSPNGALSWPCQWLHSALLILPAGVAPWVQLLAGPCWHQLFYYVRWWFALLVLVLFHIKVIWWSWRDEAKTCENTPNGSEASDSLYPLRVDRYLSILPHYENFSYWSLNLQAMCAEVNYQESFFISSGWKRLPSDTGSDVFSLSLTSEPCHFSGMCRKLLQYWPV